MSYYREIRLDELVEWLVDNITDDVQELAERLYNRFDILSESRTAT